MTNPIALGLFLFILACLGGDFLFNDAEASMFLARKFLHLVDWVVFWR